MYSTYSQFQQFQLTSQSYQDTQHTWLAVYAPGRCTALAHSMELQLHRKFRLIHSLDPLPQGLDGVVVAAEDVAAPGIFERIMVGFDRLVRFFTGEPSEAPSAVFAEVPQEAPETA